jgi:hypothetical protein
MPAHVRVAGVWRTLSPKIKVGGAWKSVSAGYVKVAGAWRKFHASQASDILELNNNHDTNITVKSYNISAVQAAAGSRLFAVTHVSGGDIDASAVSDNAGGTWVKCVSAKIAGAQPRGCAVWLRTEPLNDSALTVSYAVPGNSTGSGVSWRTVIGAPGLTLRQVGFQNDSGSGTPSATFPAPPSPDSVMMTALACGTGSVTIPAGWAYGYGISYTIPTTTVRVASRLYGETSQTISYIGTPINAQTVIAEFAP